MASPTSNRGLGVHAMVQLLERAAKIGNSSPLNAVVRVVPVQCGLWSDV